MERKLGKFPNEEDLSIGFEPGVRFFFKYDEIVKHPNAVFDGVLPLKVRDEVILNEWVHAIVIPYEYREKIQKHIPDELFDKVHFVDRNGADIWKWSEEVYEYAKRV